MIFPQLIMSGGKPIPKKDNVASRANKFASPKVKATIPAGMAFGNICLVRILLCVRPSDLEASMYCNFLTFSTSARTSRAIPGQDVKPIINTNISKEGRTKAAKARIRMNLGTAENNSVSLSTNSSIGK